jgi:hypothetical protein
MITTLTIFHRADFDGLCSEAIARKALGDSSHYLGFDYGDPIPDLAPYETVYLIDISLPVKIMLESAAKLIWIDHHKSAIEAMKGIQFRESRLIDGVAACRLAWQYFNNGLKGWSRQDYIDRKVSEPYAVQLLGEFDIWDKRNPDVDLFQLGINVQEPVWSDLLRSDNYTYIMKIVERGTVIKAYTDIINAQIITERGFDVVFEGLTFRALNIARCNSMTFTAAIKPHHEGCLAYHWNGSKWRFSLYHVDHRKDIDLSIVAVKHGGGGHRGACGFELATLPRELGGA